jgi:hypothetical protein
MILTSISNHLQKSRKNQRWQSERHQKQKNTKAPQKNHSTTKAHQKNCETTTEKTAKPPKHIRKNRETTTEETIIEKTT